MEYHIHQNILHHLQKNKQEEHINLMQFTPFDWDTLYIVAGLQMSEFLYNDYGLEGKDHSTPDDMFTYYFVLNNKVIYIEDVPLRNAQKEYIYINSFNESGQPLKTKSGVFALIKNKNKLLKVEERNIGNSDLKYYLLTPSKLID